MGTVRISRRSSSSRWKNRSNSNPRVGAEPAVAALAIQSLAPDLGRMSLNPHHAQQPADASGGRGARARSAGPAATATRPSAGPRTAPPGPHRTGPVQAPSPRCGVPRNPQPTDHRVAVGVLPAEQRERLDRSPPPRPHQHPARSPGTRERRPSPIIRTPNDGHLPPRPHPP